MFTCRKVRKSLYGYFCDLLTSTQRASLEAHIKGCLSCLNEFGKTKALFELVSKKEIPHPSNEFWQGFDTELEQRLSILHKKELKNSGFEKISLALKFLLRPEYRPILATAFVIVMVISAALFFTPHANNKSVKLALSNEEIEEDLAILDEFDEERSAQSGDETDNDIIDELDILYELDPSFS